MKISLRLCESLLLLQLISSAMLAVALPVKEGPSSRIPGLSVLDFHERTRRKVGHLDASTGPLEYMKQLHRNLTDGSGKPVNPAEDPTNIWCILDKGILQGTYREKPESTERCTSVNRFVFSWHLEDRPTTFMQVKKAVLRAYLQVIPRLVLSGETIPVDISIIADLHTHNSSESVLAGEQQVDVTRNSNGWVDLNVTEGLQALWPPRTNESELVFTVTFRVNCDSRRKVPALLVDPAEIPLQKAKRRARYLNLQPMLLVYLDDEVVKQAVTTEAHLQLAEEEADIAEQEFDSNGAAKRSADGSCDIVDFMVNFHNVRLFHILFPYSYNAKICSGSCSHTFLKRSRNLGTNHAKILASAYLISQVDSTTVFRHQPKEPCCVPTRYSALSLLVPSENGYNYELYPAMKVEQCGCR